MIGLSTEAVRPVSLSSPEFASEGAPVHFDEIGVSYAWLTEAEAEALRRNGEIASVYKHSRVSGGGRMLSLDLGDVLPGPQVPWNISLVHADDAWVTSTGEGVKVAVLDSGITKLRTDLIVAGGISFVLNVTSWVDDHGHGTACSALVGLRRGTSGLVGVTYGCSLYAVKVLDNTNSGDSDWTVAGLLWAAQQGIDVVSGRYSTSGSSEFSHFS